LLNRGRVALDSLMPKSPGSHLDLAIRNDLAELATVTNAVDRLGEEAEIPSKALIQLQVALDETLSNIIKYAWAEGGSHELKILIAAQQGEIEVVIVDDGRPFDLRAQPPPAPPSPGREPRTGGVGIHMVRQLVDRIDYARVDGCNRVTLVKQYDFSAEGITR
jgi:serine/threonine-protein kinase RsbW